MTTDEKRAVLWCLDSEIAAFDKELTARGGQRRDAYGNPVFDTVLAHLRLLQAAKGAVEKMKPE